MFAGPAHALPRHERRSTPRARRTPLSVLPSQREPLRESVQWHAERQAFESWRDDLPADDSKNPSVGRQQRAAAAPRVQASNDFTTAYPRSPTGTWASLWQARGIGVVTSMRGKLALGLQRPSNAVLVLWRLGNTGSLSDRLAADASLSVRRPPWRAPR